MHGRATALAVAFCAALAGAVPGPAAARTVDETCVLSLTRVDDQDANVLLPDASARYWLGAYEVAPGTRIRIEGAFPHARYASLSVYDAAGRPIDSLYDAQIVPDPGSTNPFLPKADRTATQRSYTAYVDPSPRPEHPAPNTLYAGQIQSGQPNVAGVLVYRVYVPDDGTDDLGGVGLPRVVLEAGSGGPDVSPQDCRDASRPSTGLGLNDLVGGIAPPSEADVLPCLGADPPVWRRNVNAAYSYSDGLLENACGSSAHDAAQQLPLGQLGHGGLYGNRDADYLIAPISRSHGQVLVIHAKAATFADTRAGAALMPFDAQLRYFSFCQYSAETTRVIACLADDRLPLDADGDYTVVVSTPAQRPATARPACGVAWLNWGPQTDGALLLRNMLPDPGFAQAIQRVTQRGDEQRTLGEYYPAARYLPDAAAFDAQWRSAAPGSGSPC